MVEVPAIRAARLRHCVDGRAHAAHRQWREHLAPRGLERGVADGDAGGGERGRHPHERVAEQRGHAAALVGLLDQAEAEPLREARRPRARLGEGGRRRGGDLPRVGVRAW